MNEKILEIIEKDIIEAVYNDILFDSDDFERKTELIFNKEIISFIDKYKSTKDLVLEKRNILIKNIENFIENIGHAKSIEETLGGNEELYNEIIETANNDAKLNELGQIKEIIQQGLNDFTILQNELNLVKTEFIKEIKNLKTILDESISDEIRESINKIEKKFNDLLQENKIIVNTVKNYKVLPSNITKNISEVANQIEFDDFISDIDSDIQDNIPIAINYEVSDEPHRPEYFIKTQRGPLKSLRLLEINEYLSNKDYFDSIKSLDKKKYYYYINPRGTDIIIYDTRENLNGAYKPVYWTPKGKLILNQIIREGYLNKVASNLRKVIDSEYLAYIWFYNFGLSSLKKE